MNELIQGILKSALCFSLLFTLYWLFLRRETWFQFNRFYLLMIAGCSLVVPRISISGLPGQAPSLVSAILAPLTVTPAGVENPPPAINLPAILAVVYFIVCGLLFIRMIHRYWQMIAIIYQRESISANGFRIITTGPQSTPFSFFHVIFLPEKGYSPAKSATVLLHEKTHARQGHSFDNLLLELFIIIQWFNPLAWLLSREMRTIHEYLADESILKTGIRKPYYQQMILDTVLTGRSSLPANHFNVSQLKKRIAMMSKSKPGSGSKMKMLSVLPLTMLLMVFFASNSLKINASPQDQEKSKGKTEQQEALKTVEFMPSFPGGDQERVKFMQENLKYPEEALKKNITGKVFVNFLVKSDGTIDQVKVLRGIGGGCDEEAVRVIKLMPKWKPGMNQGKPVDVQFTMPIQFALDGDKHEKKGEKASVPAPKKK